jgi:hypothetical protein
MDPQAQNERRQHPRYRCEGKAEIRVPDSTAVLWGTVTDLSAGGCYVELASPLPVASEAKFTLTILEATIQVDAKVAVVHPMFGMGVQFTACPQLEFQKIQEVLYQLSGLAAPLQGPASSPAPEAVSAPSPAPASAATPATASPFRISPQEACKILEQIVKQLTQKGVLTKADFMAILGKK